MTVCKSGMMGNCLVWKILKRSEVIWFGNVFGKKTTKYLFVGSKLYDAFCTGTLRSDREKPHTRGVLYFYPCTVNYKPYCSFSNLGLSFAKLASEPPGPQPYQSFHQFEYVGIELGYRVGGRVALALGSMG